MSRIATLLEKGSICKIFEKKRYQCTDCIWFANPMDGCTIPRPLYPMQEHEFHELAESLCLD